MIQHLVLDVGGVIAHPHGISDDAVKSIEKKGINLEKAMLIRAGYDDKLNKGKAKYSDFVKEYNKKTSQDWNVHEYQEVIFSNIEFNHDLIKFCKKLKETKVSVFSDNFRANVEYLNKEIKLDEWTYKQVYSYNYGVTKKKKKFYKILFDKLNAEPEECLFIDDIKENVKKAKKLGMDTIQFKNNEELFEALEDKDIS